MASTSSNNDRNLAMLCHLLALVGIVIPMGHVIGPLVLWLVKKNDSAEVDRHGKESINFQITLTMVGVALSIVAMILAFIFAPLAILPVILGFIVALGALILVILASIKASNGDFYRYPFSLPILK